jgi:hypothetical protein
VADRQPALAAVREFDAQQRFRRASRPEFRIEVQLSRGANEKGVRVSWRE